MSDSMEQSHNIIAVGQGLDVSTVRAVTACEQALGLALSLLLLLGPLAMP